MKKSGTCKHFNGIQHDACRAGLNIRELTGGEDFGWAIRIPCIKEKTSDVVCDQYAEPSPEEIAEEEEEAIYKKLIEEIRLTSPIIAEVKKYHRNENWSGTRECPVCKGTLRVSISACNTHVHGACETKGCLWWME